MLKETIEKIRPVDHTWIERAKKRLNSLTKPVGSLGRLEEFAAQVVAIRQQEMSTLSKKAIFTFAADHGITEEGVSAYPKEVTAQMVFNFLNGGAGINVLSRHAGADVVVVDVGVDYDFGELPELKIRKIRYGSQNFLKGPALKREEAVKALETGIELSDEYALKGYDILGTGDMGIGNTTPSSAIAAVYTKNPIKKITGRGTGISDDKLKRKIEVIERAINIHNPDPKDPIGVLSKVGGLEIGAIAGLILGASKNRIPVVIDGFISTAGALIAHALCPYVKDYMFASHCSAESGHRAMLEYLGLRPILDMDMRLGEGTGAALGIWLIEAGVRIYNEMATFEEAGVSDAL